MGEWKYKVGDMAQLGRDNRAVITGTKEETCSGGVQRFYLFYSVINNFSLGIGCTNVIQTPDIVFEEMVKMAGEKGGI